MKTLRNFFVLSMFSLSALYAQTPLVNFNFNSAGSFPYAANSTHSGISSSLTSNSTFTLGVGMAITGSAFFDNETGTALYIPGNAGDEFSAKYYVFELGGSSLYNYEHYELYFQTGRNATGATSLALQYSTDGTNFTHYNYYDIPAATVKAFNIDLASISELNGASSVFIKLKVYGGSSGGAFRIDNFQVRGTEVNFGGGSQSGWQISTANLGTQKNVGIGTLSPAFPLDVNGDARFSNNLQVAGTTTLNGNARVGGSLSASSFKLDAGTHHVEIEAVNTNGGPVVYFGPGSNVSSEIVCIPSFTAGTTIAPNRITIPPSNPAKLNLLDFRNDGNSSYIEFGHNSSGGPSPGYHSRGLPTVNTTWPTLKINSLCNGNVEIGFGGGTLSAGKFFEAGFPDRDFLVTSNIFANGVKTGQRITTDHPANAVPGFTVYNTQLMVNTNHTRAIGILNTITNPSGNEVFTVFGDGRTIINADVQSTDYFKVRDMSTPATPVDAFQVTGNGYLHINTPNTSQVKHVIDVHDITNDKDLFRVNSDGHVYAREVEIKAISLAFPDYVFAKDYKRLSFSELGQYIDQNKHLPGFENAAYYETNGIKTTEMFVKQQETIENLTLYILELEKRLKALEASSAK